MISLFRRNSTDTTAAARALYATIVEQSRQPGFFTFWGIPDTPNGRFEVLVLHVFLVMHRMRDDADCAKLARSLSEQAVLDVDRNLREMGVGDLSVGRKVKSLTEGLYGRLGVYAEGIERANGGLDAVLPRLLLGQPAVRRVALRHADERHRARHGVAQLAHAVSALAVAERHEHEDGLQGAAWDA